MAYSNQITSWDDVPLIMDLNYVARLIQVTPEALKQRCLKGTFPGYKEGKLWRVSKTDLINHIEDNKVTKFPIKDATA